MWISGQALGWTDRHTLKVSFIFTPLGCRRRARSEASCGCDSSRKGMNVGAMEEEIWLPKVEGEEAREMRDKRQARDGDGDGVGDGDDDESRPRRSLPPSFIPSLTSP